MEKFTKEEKELLEQNPNIQAVLSNQVYTKEFKEKAVIEYERGKSANQIFQEAEIDTSIISRQYDYPALYYYNCSSNRELLLNYL